MSFIQVSDLQKKNGIYIHNITEGMDNYCYYILEGTMEQHDRFLTELMKLGDPDDSYADFYYKRANASNLPMIKKHLSAEEGLKLDELIEECHETEAMEEFRMVKLTKENLQLLLHISYKELLFSSFYFTHIPCTVWSNYGGRFLLFIRKQFHCDSILAIAKEIGLHIEQ